MARGLLAALSLPAARVGAGATPCSGRPVVVRAAARAVGGGRARRRGLVVVRAGGPPSANALFLAFVLPLSLFVGTLITAARVADDLDERFLREMEINQAIMEENEASDEDIAGEDEREEEDEAEVVVEEKEPVVAGAGAAAAPARTRNRPRRQVQ
ncbi:hypothetical protein U9M48_016545 [Paspalum notatum var. saurae]|uniref:High chlorophyll fluorescence 153 n=1 Tax=Paspalum notatum var. saurae TaxID=547442 RepID=A0AAQ3T7N8_PASNO